MASKRRIRGYVNNLSQTEKHGYMLGAPVTEEEAAQAVSCWRKQFYGSEEKALAAAKDATTPQEPYPCEYCTGWHLTKRKKRKRGKR